MAASSILDPETTNEIGHDDDEDLSESKRTTSNTEDSSEEEELASKETKAVFRLRLLVILALFLAAAGVSLGVYMITKNSEEDEFNAQVDGNSQKIINSFEEIFKEKFAALSTLGVSFTSYATGHNKTWPFVTMNDFQQRAASARRVSDALYTQILPIITEENRALWEEYSVREKGWLDEGRLYQEDIGLRQDLGLSLIPVQPATADSGLDFSSGIGNKIYSFDLATFMPVVSQSPADWYPIWQQSPITDRDLVNWNLVEFPSFGPFIDVCAQKSELVIGGIDIYPAGGIDNTDAYTSWVATLLSFAAGRAVEYKGDPMSSIYLPVFDSHHATRKQVAVINAVINWKKYFEGILPDAGYGMVAVLANNCQGAFTYSITGPEVTYMGPGDLHDSEYNDYAQTARLADLLDENINGLKLNQDVCEYVLTVYPSDEMHSTFTTNLPVILTIGAAAIFLFTAFMFVLYDRLVERRQKLVLSTAKTSTAIVSSLFPETITKRLMEEGAKTASKKNFVSANNRLKSFLNDGKDEDIVDSQPIADMFPFTTVLFADVAGFTSWSTSRDPSQVFILLESIYKSFDALAVRHKIFKVETIGDSYVAVAGLPNPQPKHFLLMARFAAACMSRFSDLTKKLEVALGPDTADLGLRIGIHSGPVTAGVLRGDRSRFQLFGDTVNKAARMESTGMSNRIQVSNATADLLKSAGKGHWLFRREGVHAKGIGVLDTYWLDVNARSHDSRSETGSEINGTEEMNLTELSPKANKRDRLIEWMVELMLERIREVVALREMNGVKRENPAKVTFTPKEGETCLDEVNDVIQLAKFDANAAICDSSNVEVPSEVVEQLRSCVRTIAMTYLENPFHSFEHACHVTMSVDKFLKRIVAPDVDSKMAAGDIASHLHHYTHGINSDPIAILAIVFSAMIHDSDHRGVSNQQLCKESEQMANLYRNQSVAEQNSLDLSWSILMDSRHKELREFMFATKKELLHFRQVVINVVLATDIFDKQLNDLRKRRWNRAFSGDETTVDHDLRATIVLEHIIQASDVSHTMQHWHTYRKWNERLFAEMTKAFKEGRMGADPATFWYKGELGFFDNYVIPLAKKLKDCNVFGVSSDECLCYALQNRSEWNERGEQIVQELVQKYAESSRSNSGDAP